MSSLWKKYTDAWSPKARSVLRMALASAIHFAGYEYARTGTLTLVTSDRAGFSSSSVVPLAMACVSPVSLVLLWLYARMLDYAGPSVALRNCTLIYAAVLAFCGAFLQSIDGHMEAQGLHHQLGRFLLFGLFILENCFVQLLCTQHWAFMTSVQTRDEAAVWFGPIAGIGSIISTAAAFTVAPLIDILGLASLLVLSGLFMLVSAYFAMDAYRIAAQHGFEPAPTEKEKKCIAENDGKSFLQRALALFARVPLLGALCVEVFFSQSQSSLLNSLFVLKLRDAIPDDDERARYTGNCYAGINSFSGVLHFGVLPMMVKKLDNQLLWLIMPGVMVVFSAMVTLQKAESVNLISFTFLVMKAMEYSVRGITTEMVYVSLDFESRFLGKEIIGVFVNRVGKSAVSLSLSAVTAYFGSHFDLQYLSITVLVVSIAWFWVSYQLTTFLAEESTSSATTTDGKDDKSKTD